MRLLAASIATPLIVAHHDLSNSQPEAAWRVRLPMSGDNARTRLNPCCSLEDVVMSDFDFSPLFRSTIGFDRLMRLADAATRVDAGTWFGVGLAVFPLTVSKISTQGTHHERQ